MLQQKEAEDYVLATGETTSVRDFVSMAFKETGVDIEWKGSGVDEKGYDAATGTLLVQVDPKYFRPTEVDLLIGDSSKAKKNLKWSSKIAVSELVKDMVQADMIKFEKDKLLKDGGHRVPDFNE